MPYRAGGKVTFTVAGITATAEADALIAHLADLRAQLHYVDLAPQRLGFAVQPGGRHASERCCGDRGFPPSAYACRAPISLLGV
jgi:hypothetical protein